MRSSARVRAALVGRSMMVKLALIGISFNVVLPAQSLRAENPPLPVHDAVRTARGELEVARLRAMEKFDRSVTGKALAEHVQTCEAKLAAAMENQSEHEQIAAAMGLQNARAVQDAAREAAIEADPSVRQAEAKMMRRETTRGSKAGE